MSMNSNGGYWVSDEWRTNPDSLIPGGSVVSVEYHNGEIKMYDKIKKPIHHMNVIMAKGVGIKSISVDGEIAWQSN